MSALDSIIEYKKDEVADLRSRHTLQSLRSTAEASEPARDFVGSIKKTIQAEKNALICEFKRKSPSAGKINFNSRPEFVAKSYENGGAACISVLTDYPSFGGNLDDLQLIRNSVSLPILRKDFIIDEAQIFEAKANNADAILLIMAVLDNSHAMDLYQCANEIGLSVLVESHNQSELERALLLPSPLIGINNRDLTRMVTDLSTTETLSKFVPEDRILISESGIHASSDIARLRKAGAKCFLIGENLMKKDNIQDRVNSYVAVS